MCFKHHYVTVEDLDEADEDHEDSTILKALKMSKRNWTAGPIIGKILSIFF